MGLLQKRQISRECTRIDTNESGFATSYPDFVFIRVRSRLIYSYRNAMTGSILAAFIAG